MRKKLSHRSGSTDCRACICPKKVPTFIWLHAQGVKKWTYTLESMRQYMKMFHSLNLNHREIQLRQSWWVLEFSMTASVSNKTFQVISLVALVAVRTQPQLKNTLTTYRMHLHTFEYLILDFVYWASFYPGHSPYHIQQQLDKYTYLYRVDPAATGRARPLKWHYLNTPRRKGSKCIPTLTPNPRGR